MAAPSRPDPAPETSTTGLVVLGMLVLVFSVVVVLQRSSRVVEPATAPPVVEADVPGFRTDAWLLPDDETLGFVEIPAGPFLMGSDPDRDPLAFDNEVWPSTGGAATLDLPTFWIGRFEVTVAQFGAFVSATGHPVPDETLAAPRDHPVTWVTWPDALAYARWLERALAASSVTPPDLARRLADGWRVDLPTEAQWEKAARGPDGRIYPWGDEPRRDRANFASTGLAAVGRYPCPECSYPVADLSGNVWELTRSPFGPYPIDGARSPDLGVDALWVMRGGHFGDGARNVRGAIRGGADPGARRPFIGFRVVLTPDPSDATRPYPLQASWPHSHRSSGMSLASSQ